MHILFDLRTLDELPLTGRIYLLAMVDSLLPALGEDDRVTVLLANAATFPFQPIEHAAVCYCRVAARGRTRAGARELTEIVAQRQVDVYWSVDPLMSPPVGHLARQLVVVYAVEELRHFLDRQAFSWRERMQWRWQARRRLLGADVLVCPSHALAVRLIAYLGWGARRRTRVIANGVHPIFRVHTAEEVVRVRRRWLVPQRYALMIETAGAVSCLEVPLRALARNEEVSSVTCVVVGRAELPEMLRETVRACHLEGMVRFLPREQLSAADLSALYSGATVLFEPARWTDFRPTIGQCLACGTPVICAAGATNEELFGNAVLRVHPTDPAEWGRAFSALMLSAALRERLRERGAACVAERTWTATAKAAFGVCREALSMRGRVAALRERAGVGRAGKRGAQ